MMPFAALRRARDHGWRGQAPPSLTASCGRRRTTRKLMAATADSMRRLMSLLSVEALILSDARTSNARARALPWRTALLDTVCITLLLHKADGAPVRRRDHKQRAAAAGAPHRS
jgi:hypothetical protein